MPIYEYLEGGMLFLFSISWYLSIYHMLRVRRASGKSGMFVTLICIGYLLGITAKLVAWEQTGHLSPVIWIYAWNFVVTVLDLLLVIYFTRRERIALVA